MPESPDTNSQTNSTETAQSSAALADSPSHRDNNFNFLRLVFATLVILAHSPPLISSDHSDPMNAFFDKIWFAAAPVCGFFLLSGYLIVQSWQRDPRLIDYILKRVLRIYPGFVIASLVCAVVVGPLGARSATDYWAHFRILTFTKGMAFLSMPFIPAVFVGSPYEAVNGSMWTILYEFRCYLLVALLGICGLVKQKWLWLIGAIAALLVSMLSDPKISHLIHLNEDWWNNFHLLSFFCAGACFHHFRDRIRYRNRWAIVAALILIPCLFLPALRYLALMTAGGYLLFWFAFAPFPILNGFRRWSDISYGVYLYGWPIQKLLLWYTPISSPLLLFVVATPLSYLCGLASWQLVEKPFMRLKKKIAP